MKILVLGATGFVGSYLMERAIAAGHEVLGTSYNPTINVRDWAAFQDKVVRCDIRYREQTDEVVAGFRPDVVYLLSAQTIRRCPGRLRWKPWIPTCWGPRMCLSRSGPLV